VLDSIDRVLEVPGGLVSCLFSSPDTVALRVSNWVAIGMLFLTGYIFVRSTGHRPLPLGCTTVLVGALLTGVAIALGG
jgi:hypothetical protein